MALLNSRALKREMNPVKTPNVAAKDIVRKNDIGQHVLVVPKGQPIPEGLEVTDEERGVKKKVERLENKASEGRPTPKSTSK